MDLYYLGPFWPFTKMVRFHACDNIADFSLENSSGQPSFCMVFKLTHYENHIHTLPQFSFLFWWGWGRGVVVVFFSCLAYRRECFLQLGSFSLVLLSDSHIMSEIATHTHPY